MTTHPRNYPDDQIEHPDEGRSDHYDDFIASDVLAAFIRDPDTYAKLDTVTAIHGDGQDHYYLDLEGTLVLSPEQAAALSPLFAPPSDG